MCCACEGLWEVAPQVHVQVWGCGCAPPTCQRDSKDTARARRLAWRHHIAPAGALGPHGCVIIELTKNGQGLLCELQVLPQWSCAQVREMIMGHSGLGKRATPSERRLLPVPCSAVHAPGAQPRGGGTCPRSSWQSALAPGSITMLNAGPILHTPVCKHAGRDCSARPALAEKGEAYKRRMSGS